MECVSGRCIGNGGGLLSAFGNLNAGTCDYDDGSRSSGDTCNKNDNCESGRCIGNGGGLLSSFGALDAGQCDYNDGSRGPEETCNKNDNCENGVCIGNGGGLLSSFGDFDAGHCGYLANTRGGRCDCWDTLDAATKSSYEAFDGSCAGDIPDGYVAFRAKVVQSESPTIVRATCQVCLPRAPL